MKKKILFILLFIINNICLSEKPEYEYWGDDFFENPNRDTINQFAVPEVSAGFFPKIPSGLYIYWGQETDGWDYSKGSFFISDIFPKNTNQFFAQPENDDILDAMEEKEPFSEEDKYGWFTGDKSRNNFDIGIKFEYMFSSLRTAILINAGIKTRYITAYSNVRTSSYLNHNGTKSNFEQISFAEINDQHIYIDFNFKHPIYGFSYLKRYNNGTLSESFAMFYYLLYGLGINYAYLDKINVYDYIISEQSNIRFSNGEIRQPSIFKYDYDKVKSTRYYYDFGIGWQTGIQTGTNIDKAIANLELLYRHSINPIIKNTNYKQNMLIFKAAVNISFVYDLVIGLIN